MKGKKTREVGWGKGGGGDRTVSQRQRRKRREKDGRRVSGGEENSREAGDLDKLKHREKKKSAGLKVGCKEFVQNNMSSFKQTHKQQAGWCGSFSWEGDES